MRKLILLFFISIFGSNAYADFTSNLQVWWKFDEGAGTAAIDSSTNGNNGTHILAPSYVAGKIGPFALNFNGTSQYVDSSNIASIDNQANFTVSVWFNTSSTPPGGCGAALAAKVGAGGISAGQGWGIFMPNASCGYPTGVIAGGIQQAGPSYLSKSTTATYTDGNWHQAVLVVTGGNTVTLYVDGLIPAESNNSGGVISTYSNAVNFRVAGDYDTEFFPGKIDDVRVYNRALTAIDVAQLYAYTGRNFFYVGPSKVGKAKIGF